MAHKPMEPEQVLATFDFANKGVPTPYTIHDALHALHEDPRVRDAMWFALDHGVIKLNIIDAAVKEMQKVLTGIEQRKWADLSVEERDAKRRKFLFNHGIAELLFLGAWRMYRTGNLDAARNAVTRAKQFQPDFPTADKLIYLLDHPERWTHKTFPALVNAKGYRVETALDNEMPSDRLEADLRWVL